MAGAIRCRAGPLCCALAKPGRHAAERSLVNLAIFGAREGHSVVLQLDNRVGRFLAHVLDRVLVTQPVRTFHCVIHVPAPVVLAHVAQRGADTALRSYCVAARRKYLGDARRLEVLMGQPERCAQARAAGTDNDNVVIVVNKFVVAHAPNPIS